MKISAEQLNLINTPVEENVSVASQMIEEVVQGYTAELDTEMMAIKEEIVNAEYEPPLIIIENHFVKLANLVYFTSAQVEKVGIYSKIAQAQAKEAYNDAYLKHQHSNDGVTGGKKPTIAESQAVAEGNTMYEATLDSVYGQAYKIIKNKIQSAEMMVNTLSKLYQRRMRESEQMQTRMGRMTLNEDFA